MTAFAPARPHAGSADATPPATTAAEAPPGRVALWRRPRVGLSGLLLVTAVLYLWNLSESGYGNSFYAAAVQAGTRSWKAFFFGSLDNANAITVDKPPASLWVMELSGRLFGFNSWSLLAPQALEGVATVALLYAAVRRVRGHGAGMVAGAALALTPAAVLMFRFDNPDALLTLLLVAAAYAVTRALESASTRWLLLAGTALGFGFLTKMGQSFLILPGLGLAYLVCAPTTVRRRIVQLLLGGAAVVVSAGWYVGVVALVPASDRPFIAGSGDDSVLGLALGYNGFSRIFGSGSGSGPGGGGGGIGGNGSFGGATGITRLFRSEMGLEVSWLLPAALLALVAGLIVTARRARTSRTRAALVVWGGWLLGTGVVLSYMQGVVHPYYTVALAPGVAACLAIGGHLLWTRRPSATARVGLALLVIVTAVWSEHLLAAQTWGSALTWLVGAGAVAALLALAVPGRLHAGRRAGRLAVALTLAGALVGSAGAAWAVATAGVAHTGSIPDAGPASASTSGFGGMGGGARPTFSGSAPAGAPTGFAPAGAPSGSGPAGAPSGSPSGSAPAGAPTGGSGPGAGGQTNSSLTALLAATTTRWAAATVGATTAADLELATGKAVIAIGGWNGSDNAPTLAQFEAMVKAGQVRYLISGGQGGPGGGTSAITTWVAAHYTATTVGGTSVYDLTATAH